MDSQAAILQSLLELSTDTAAQGTWQWDPASGRLSCSDRCRALLGLAENPSALDGMLAKLEPSDRDKVRGQLDGLAGQGGSLDMRCRAAPGGGKTGAIRLRAVAVQLPELGARQIVGIVADSDSNGTQGEAHERLAAIVTSSDDAIIGKTLDGIVTSWNKGAERIFGYTAVEMIGRPIEILAAPGLEDDMANILEKIRRGERVDHYQTKRRHKNGSILNIFVTVSPIHDAQGKLVGASKVARDMTLAANSGEEIVEREAHLRSILDTVPDGMIIIDERGKIESFSSAAERMFGYDASDVRGKNVSVLMPSPNREAHDGYLRRYLTTGERRIIGIGRRVMGRRKDGTQFPLDLTIGEVTRRGRRLFTGFTRDLTEREEADLRFRELHAELLHMSRLSAMGQLAAMLAHELNQPLTAVMNYAEAARQMIAGPRERLPRAEEFMQKAAGQAERAGQIIRRLRAFVQKGAIERVEEQLSLVVEDAANLAATGTKIDGIELIFDLADDLPPILIDRTQIQQVVVNLVRNATDVLRQAERRTITIQTTLTGDEFQEVAVHDTGPGIPPEMADQMFKPFVTTKSEGMGIGLSISQSIIEAHGGRIWTEPNPDGGTIFRFRLPQGGGAGDKP
jgi:two-component system sensor kinase FixL